jgi:Uncharacterized alpha/beta hydrolase domain (DUF2235)
MTQVNHRLAQLKGAEQGSAALAQSAAAMGTGPAAAAAPAATLQKPSLKDRAQAITASLEGQAPPASCQQCVYVSFFFDGTGNNLKADRPTLEHSNVARMFLAMPGDSDITGVYTRYVPGIDQRSGTSLAANKPRRTAPDEARG